MTSFIFQKCSSYHDDEVYSAVKQAVKDLGGMEKFVKPGDKVLLKPNILGKFKPDDAATTHPAVVKAVIRLVKEAKGIPSIGESPGFGTLKLYTAITGIKAVAGEEKVPIVDLITPKETSFPEGKAFKKFIVARELDDFDVIINLPKFKTHQLTGITNAVKNIFGVIPGILKSQYHYKIQKRSEFIQMLDDLANLIKPRLTIMDAVWGMEGEGPSNGKPRFMGMIGAASDCKELDEAMVKVINGEPVQGFSIPDFIKIDLEPEEMSHLPITWLQNWLWRSLSEKPVIEQAKCTNCGTCIKVCTPKAIMQGKGVPYFNYSKCIRCFCCSEMCPERAIKIRRNTVFGLILRLLSRI